MYTDRNGRNIIVQIECKRVVWKCNGNTSDIFSERWCNLRYEWQNQRSDLVLRLKQNDNPLLSHRDTNDSRDDDENNNNSQDDKKNADNNLMHYLIADRDEEKSTHAQNCRYLAVFGGEYDVGKYYIDLGEEAPWASRKHFPKIIAILDTKNLEWYLSESTIPPSPIEASIDSLTDDKGFLYILNSYMIRRFDTGIDTEQFKVVIDSNVDAAGKLSDKGMKLAILLFDDVFLYQHEHKFIRWEYICDKQLINPIVLFDKYLSDDNVAQMLTSLWVMVKDGYVCIETVSEWVERGYLMQNIHFLFAHQCWQVKDIHLLNKLVGSWHGVDEFDSDESALLYHTCQYNNATLLKYLINNKICNKNNHNIKNKKTGQTCLDTALMKDCDECINILIKEFGYKSASILKSRQIKTGNLQINALASRELSVLKMYDKNGIDWNIPDEKGWHIIDHILKHENYETLDYVINNDIFSLDECIDKIYSCNFGHNQTKCIKVLCDVIANTMNIVEHRTLFRVILHDSDKILEALLTLIIKRQTITNMRSYGENDICSIDECIESLLSCDFSNNPKKCCKILSSMIVNDINHISQHNTLRLAIKYDLRNDLRDKITLILKRQGIDGIKSYHENKVVTFEFLFNLLKLCRNNDTQCAILLKSWLQTVTKYHLKSLYHSDNGWNSPINQDNNENLHDDLCILCLEQIPRGTNEDDYDHDYCSCCDFFICQNCGKMDNYQFKRV